MNREIFFKAKRKDNGEWVEGYLFDDGMPKPKRYFIGGIIVKPYEGTACDKWNIVGIDFFEIDIDTLCQYTGLTDKNGKKIFEGDVVKYVDVCGEVKFGLHESTWQINKYNQGFFVTFPKEYSLRSELGFWRNKIVVIGNIFDNADLLEVE